MKQLGVGIELWDRLWVDACRKRHRVSGGPSETEDGSRQREEGRPPAAVRTGYEQETISQGQYGRLRGIMKTAGRTKLEVLPYLKAFYGVEQAREIKRRDYNDICKAIEQKGPLPKKEPVREPDEVLPPITDADIPWTLKR